ncbi:MAG: MobH family relaxase [Gammaproteobacteria bacterium]|jgi:integrating conjugative element relaxase (TIGR03760 family)|nr:MobH family relaxase [Gammaproteobacteria bacterium]MDP2348765.1 MobH family relaxase [Gammaproteobacteria bacterium]
MFSLFQRKRVPTAGAPSTASIAMPQGLTKPESAASLLATPRRRKLLEHIWQRTSLSRKQFAALYLTPLERYAELVQQFPASESHHHAYPGGMLDHGLEIVAYALKLRQSHLLPAGVTPEAQAAQAEAWTAGTAYAALLHDIGKIAVDLHVEYADGTLWHPWHGPLQRPYRFRYRKDREYRLHSAATGLLYIRLLDREILDWLNGFSDLWASLLYVLAGQYEHAGTLGELVVQADQASVAHELGGDPNKALAAPKHALQRKLLDGLRYLLKEEFKLNQPQASDGWLTQDALWLVSKTVSDKLRAHLLSQGIDGIPASNTAVFNVLQDHGIALATPDGKAIWKASVTSDAGWSHSFTFLKLSPAMIWEASDRPAAFAGTVQVEPEGSAAQTPAPEAIDVETGESAPATTESATPTTADSSVEELLELLDSSPASTATAVPLQPLAEKPTPLPDHKPADTTPVQAVHQDDANPSGAHFLAWLRQSIQTRKLIINDAKALVHTVAGTAYLVSPGVFQRYAQEHPQITALAKQDKLPEWQWVQKRFEKLGLHRKQASGLNIWNCEVTGPRKSRRLHGYLLTSPETLFHETPPNNPYLRLANTEAKRDDSAFHAKNDDEQE